MFIYSDVRRVESQAAHSVTRLLEEITNLYGNKLWRETKHGVYFLNSQGTDCGKRVNWSCKYFGILEILFQWTHIFFPQTLFCSLFSGSRGFLIKENYMIEISLLKFRDLAHVGSQEVCQDNVLPDSVAPSSMLSLWRGNE